MKRFKLISQIPAMMAAMFLTLTLQAQKNNPYNQKGVDILASTKTIQQDYASGKFSGVTNETIDYYARSLPVKVQNVQLGAVSNIISTVKNNLSNVDAFINNSALSANSKQIAKDLFAICKAPNALANLTNKSAQINASDISSAEKELTLTISAVLYNYVADYTTNGLAKVGDVDCYVNGVPAPCPAVGTIAGVIIGGVAGFYCCGPIGAVVGAIIGGVIGNALGSLS